MEIFQIQPDKKNWGILFNDTVDASHSWKMPGIKCSLCGKTWAMIGISYPNVDLSHLLRDSQYFKPRSVSIEVYRKLRDLIVDIVPNGLPIPPGTDFGPLIGEARGKFGDFSWPDLWTLLIKNLSYSKLVSSEIRLPEASKPKLQFMDDNFFDLLELQIEAHAFLSQKSYSSPEPEICSLCGRDNRKVEKIIIDEESIPSDLDMFRIRDFPTKILVTNRFRNAVTKHNMTNILFSKIEVY